MFNILLKIIWRYIISIYIFRTFFPSVLNTEQTTTGFSDICFSVWPTITVARGYVQNYTSAVITVARGCRVTFPEVNLSLRLLFANTCLSLLLLTVHQSTVISLLLVTQYTVSVTAIYGRLHLLIPLLISMHYSNSFS